MSESYEKLRRRRKPKSPSPAPTRKEADLYIDVSVAPGRAGRIAVNRGDNPRELADGFAKTFQLDKQAKEALVRLLVENMRALFG